MVALDWLALQVADLSLCLDARGTKLALAAKGSLTKFQAPDEIDCSLLLRVETGLPVGSDRWRPLFDSSTSWSLWLDPLGRQVFRSPLDQVPVTHVFVEEGFRSGEVLLDLTSTSESDGTLYPLQYLDIMLYANWLSIFGDFMVHAAGVDDSGEGYCFVGASGVGKSTLASAWSASLPGSVLGDDQVIVRRIDGKYWLFGTPWHQNPERCSPGRVPLTKVFFLEQGDANEHHICEPGAAGVRLLENSFAPLYDASGMTRILHNLDHLVEQVPFYKLVLHSPAEVLDYVRRV